MDMSQPVRQTFDKLKARAMMDAAGKSYADLGRALGIERQAVGHWFRDRGEPSVQQMKMMAQELGCHWLELVHESTMVVYQEDEIRRLERLRSLTPEALAKLDAFLDVEQPKQPK
jgi:transcriptional regulator with XRE-family HTH domain